MTAGFNADSSNPPDFFTHFRPVPWLPYMDEQISKLSHIVVYLSNSLHKERKKSFEYSLSANFELHILQKTYIHSRFLVYQPPIKDTTISHNIMVTKESHKGHGNWIFFKEFRRFNKIDFNVLTVSLKGTNYNRIQKSTGSSASAHDRENWQTFENAAKQMATCQCSTAQFSSSLSQRPSRWRGFQKKVD